MAGSAVGIGDYAVGIDLTMACESDPAWFVVALTAGDALVNGQPQRVNVSGVAEAAKG
jgi:hypothetical protein